MSSNPELDKVLADALAKVQCGLLEAFAESVPAKEIVRILSGKCKTLVILADAKGPEGAGDGNVSTLLQGDAPDVGMALFFLSQGYADDLKDTANAANGSSLEAAVKANVKAGLRSPERARRLAAIRMN